MKKDKQKKVGVMNTLKKGVGVASAFTKGVVQTASSPEGKKKIKELHKSIKNFNDTFHI